MKAGSEPEIAMPYNTGYEVDAENQQVSYYYRDDAAFVDGTLKDMDKIIELLIILKVLPLRNNKAF